MRKESREELFIPDAYPPFQQTKAQAQTFLSLLKHIYIVNLHPNVTFWYLQLYNIESKKKIMLKKEHLRRKWI
jgi:hypothetical protein